MKLKEEFWFDASDAVPEEGITVLVCTGLGTIGFGCYLNRDWMAEGPPWELDYVEADSIRYWRYLPRRPVLNIKTHAKNRLVKQYTPK